MNSEVQLDQLFRNSVRYILEDAARKNFDSLSQKHILPFLDFHNTHPNGIHEFPEAYPAIEGQLGLEAIHVFEKDHQNLGFNRQQATLVLGLGHDISTWHKIPFLEVKLKVYYSYPSEEPLIEEPLEIISMTPKFYSQYDEDEGVLYEGYGEFEDVIHAEISQLESLSLHSESSIFSTAAYMAYLSEYLLGLEQFKKLL